jgi:hypothetical protein
MKTTLLPFLLLLSFFSNAQSSFEGEIIYQNYDEEMKPTNKTIYKVKGDKVTHYIHNDKKNLICYPFDSFGYMKIGDEFKKMSNKFDKSNLPIKSKVNKLDSIANLVFHIKYIKDVKPNFMGTPYQMNMVTYISLDSSIKVNFVNYFELPLHNEYGYLIKAKKNITKSEYFNRTIYSIFQSMTAKPIEDSEFEPE